MVNGVLFIGKRSNHIVLYYTLHLVLLINLDVLPTFPEKVQIDIEI